MKTLTQQFSVHYGYDTYFTKDLFAPENPLLLTLLKNTPFYHPIKWLIVIDQTVAHDHLLEKIQQFIHSHPGIVQATTAPLILPGGEDVKNNPHYVAQIYQTILDNALCRHSVVLAIGGGALLDAVGFAAATAHRGIPLIRIPTTVLSQADSGVGVKNSINYQNKKNLLGTFTLPYAVINDSDFLLTLSQRDWRAGIAEAIKVALIKDKDFFLFLKSAAPLIEQRQISTLEKIIYHSAQLHMQHIGKGGDPFENGSSRPLDFGHWAAHKLEVLSKYALRHGEAVSIGIALDVTYGFVQGFLDATQWKAILQLLEDYHLPLYHPLLKHKQLFQGLDEFREHLGGQLTLLMLKNVSECFNIHAVNIHDYQRAIGLLAEASIRHQSVSHVV